MYAIAATAETNRSPFDLPEENRSWWPATTRNIPDFKFALFFLGE